MLQLTTSLQPLTLWKATYSRPVQCLISFEIDEIYSADDKNKKSSMINCTFYSSSGKLYFAIWQRNIFALSPATFTCFFSRIPQYSEYSECCYTTIINIYLIRLTQVYSFKMPFIKKTEDSFLQPFLFCSICLFLNCIYSNVCTQCLGQRFEIRSYN